MAANPGKKLSEKDMLKEISPIGRFAQGDYVCECANCDRQFIGDKRATQCLACAMKSIAETSASE